MDRMKFGVDIDGVLNPHHTFMQDFIKKEFGLFVPLDDYNIMGHAGLKTSEDYDNFYDRYEQDLLDQMPATIMASEMLQDLIDKGVEIYIITARPSRARIPTIAWLANKNLPYDKLVMDGGHKIGACLQHDVSIMVDDSPHNVTALNDGGVTTLRFNWPYNKDTTGDNVYPVSDWKEIYKFVTNYFNLD